MTAVELTVVSLVIICWITSLFWITNSHIDSAIDKVIQAINNKDQQ